MKASLNREISNFPGLFVALHLFLGVAFALKPHFIYLLPLALLWMASKRCLPSLVLLLAAFGFTHFRVSTPTIPENGLPGVGYLEIDSIQPHHGPFFSSLVYRGHLRCFRAGDQSFSDLPCTIFFKRDQKRPPATQDYLVQGKLKAQEHGGFTLKPEKDFIWEPIAKSWSLAEWRFGLKEKVRAHLNHVFPHKHAAHFLSTMATGDVDDRVLSMEFNKVGLSHILAISGLHFVLLFAFLSFMLNLFLPRRFSLLLCLILLSAYFLFLGLTPSILRAYIAIALFLLSRLKGQTTNALNLLGIGVIVEILIDPLYVQNLGFQLSFLCTLGLLLFTTPLNQKLKKIFPERDLQTALEMSRLDQVGLGMIGLIRTSLAANLAAHLLSLPLCLFTFHSFPILSFFYNLFFPFCLGLSFLLLCISLLIGLLIPPFGNLLHLCNSYFTTGILQIIGNPPEIYNFRFNLSSFPYSLLILLLTLPLWLLTKTSFLSRIIPFRRS